MAVSVLTPGSATAGWNEGHAAYERGDYHAALREFMPLAVAGYSSAQLNSGLIYASGQGVPQNDAEAVRWYRMAADQGDANLGTMCGRGQGVPQDRGGALASYGRREGEALAQFNLGAM